ncbi:MAG: hypothetical protein SFZ03_01910 [Candidatus Melainabacteria bacterium]|nr:hypothetical protein [Candidatus Melainabacteria bacterium]
MLPAISAGLASASTAMRHSKPWVLPPQHAQPAERFGHQPVGASNCLEGLDRWQQQLSPFSRVPLLYPHTLPAGVVNETLARDLLNQAYQAALRVSRVPRPDSFQVMPYGMYGAAVKLAGRPEIWAQGNLKFNDEGDGVCAERRTLAESLEWGVLDAQWMQKTQQQFQLVWQPVEGSWRPWSRTAVCGPSPFEGLARYANQLAQWYQSHPAPPPQVQAIAMVPMNPTDPQVLQFGFCAVCLETLQNESAVTRNTVALMPRLLSPPQNQPSTTTQPNRPPALVIEARPVADYLPFKDRIVPACVPPDVALPAFLKQTEVRLSNRAKQAAFSLHLTHQQVCQLAQKTILAAATACQEETTFQRVHRNPYQAGAALLFAADASHLPYDSWSPLANNPIVKGSNICFSGRSWIRAIPDALSKALSADGGNIRHGESLLMAAVYSPWDSLLDHPEDLDALAKVAGHEEVLLATLWRDPFIASDPLHVEILTVADCLPIRYQKRQDFPRRLNDHDHRANVDS